MIQARVLELDEELDHLNREEMTEEKFWGMAFDGEDEDFDYGRDVLKKGTYEDTCKLPYQILPLF